MNKVSSCVEVRFNVADAVFLSEDVKERLLKLEKGRMNKEGELFVVAQDERTQERNRSIALGRLSSIIEAAFVVPKERKQWKGVGGKTKLKRKEFKQARKNVKSNRRAKDL